MCLGGLQVRMIINMCSKYVYLCRFVYIYIHTCNYMYIYMLKTVFIQSTTCKTNAMALVDLGHAILLQNQSFLHPSSQLKI